jgi:hypothetical protein
VPSITLPRYDPRGWFPAGQPGFASELAVWLPIAADRVGAAADRDAEAARLAGHVWPDPWNSPIAWPDSMGRQVDAREFLQAFDAAATVFGRTAAPPGGWYVEAPPVRVADWIDAAVNLHRCTLRYWRSSEEPSAGVRPTQLDQLYTRVLRQLRKLEGAVGVPPLSVAQFDVLARAHLPAVIGVCRWADRLSYGIHLRNSRTGLRDRLADDVAALPTDPVLPLPRPKNPSVPVPLGLERHPTPEDPDGYDGGPASSPAGSGGTGRAGSMGPITTAQAAKYLGMNQKAVSRVVCRLPGWVKDDRNRWSGPAGPVMRYGERRRRPHDEPDEVFGCVWVCGDEHATVSEGPTKPRRCDKPGCGRTDLTRVRRPN